MIAMKKLLIATLFVGAVLAPETARADGFVVPWVGGNAGSHNAGGLIDFGASVGATAASVVDFDVDVGYSPDFFGNGVNSYVLTTMGNLTLGIPIGGTSAPRIRPYVAGGLGLIRARIEDTRFGYALGRNDIGVNVGGGVTAFVSGHIGVRGDLRYIRSLEDDTSNPFTQFDLGPLHYWRTSIGLVIR